MIKQLLPILLLAGIATTSCAQSEIPLYPGAIPNSKATADSSSMQGGIARKVSRPTLTAFLPEADKATGAAVVICPGGGYGVLVMQGEGFNTAKYFQQKGIAAFVLKYRLPDDATMTDKSIGPLQDAQQAIRVVRMRAKEWKIDTARVGIMGFSAGGHLASTAATHFNEKVLPNPEGVNLRPTFSLLVYPVISLSEKLGHVGSTTALLGKNPSAEKIRMFSNDEQVTSNTPPAFLIHAADDNVVNVDNSLNYFQALRKQKIPAELHIYPKGNHGFVLRWPVDEWMSLCMRWMTENGWIPKAAK